MKRIAPIILIFSFLLVSCTSGPSRNVQSKERHPLADLAIGMSYGMAGWDPSCIRAIRSMVEAGQITKEMGSYMIEKQCKTQQEKPPPSMDIGGGPFSCPFCGSLGRVIDRRDTGIRSIKTYKCINGHIWQAD